MLYLEKVLQAPRLLFTLSVIYIPADPDHVFHRFHFHFHLQLRSF